MKNFDPIKYIISELPRPDGLELKIDSTRHYSPFYGRVITTCCVKVSEDWFFIDRVEGRAGTIRWARQGRDIAPWLSEEWERLYQIELQKQPK